MRPLEAERSREQGADSALSRGASEGAFAPVLERNIHALVTRRKTEDARKSREDRLADLIARFAGSMWSVYVHLLVFGVWIVWNLPWFSWPKFDAEYVKLAMFASVEAIFLSTFVLITQNRLSAQAEKRADLDLQVSLLAEHEITRLITLLSAVGAKLGVQEAHDPSLDPLRKDVAPEQVLERLDRVDGE